MVARLGGDEFAVLVPAIPGSDPELLLQRADVAMYQAKAGHTDIEVYAPERDQYSPRRLALVGALRTAIEQRELTLVYQPKIELATRRMVGVEALVRWHHPEHGFVPPDEFIAIAESTALIQPLGQCHGVFYGRLLCMTMFVRRGACVGLPHA